MDLKTLDKEVGIYTHTCTSIHPYIHTYIHTCMHACMHAYIHIILHIGEHIHMHTHTHIYIYVYIYIYIGPELLPSAGEDRRAPEPRKCPSGRGSTCHGAAAAEGHACLERRRLNG